jgi:hypothetical protein
MVVRFKVDACVSDSNNITKAIPDSDDVDNLTNSLAATSISSVDSTTVSSSSPSALTIQRKGMLVPQQNIAELATRAAHRVNEYDWADTYPQLELSQTPHHILAAHERGTFTGIFHRTLKGPELAAEALAGREGLVKLRAILEALQELVVEYGKTTGLSLVCKDGQLMAYEREGSKGCLPEEYLKRFDA